MREWPAKSFLGGHAVLDFLNTAGGDTKARDEERLESFSDLLTWAKASAIIDKNEFSALRRIAAQSPDTAFECLQEVRKQRECLYRYILAVAGRGAVQQADRDVVERNCKAAFRQAQLQPLTGVSQWQILLDDVGLRLVKLRLDLATSTLITGPVSANIRQCEMCTWLFIDLSSSKRRRWCSMALCGNRAKVQRHYYRNRDSEAPR
jgi:predicted RNA-binding Zn ribbon-like protein